MSAITAPGVVEDRYEDRVGPAPTLLDASLMPRVSTIPFEEEAVRDILAGAIGQPVDDTDLSVVRRAKRRSRDETAELVSARQQCVVGRTAGSMQKPLLR